MKRLRYSQVRGISIKMQEEEERERRVPEVSALESDIIIESDPETNEMLKMLVCKRQSSSSAFNNISLFSKYFFKSQINIMIQSEVMLLN